MLNIALVARSQQRVLMLDVMRKFKAIKPCRIYMYCFSAQEVLYYKKANVDGLLDEILDFSAATGLREKSQNKDEESLIERSRILENMLGVTINRLLVGERHFGRGYSLGGFYHPRSRLSENNDYYDVLNIYCKKFDYWINEFKSKKINLVINGTKEAAFVARSIGIPYRALARSRIKNLHFWAHNEMYETPAFEEAWARIAKTDDDEVTEPYHSHLLSKKNYLNKFTAKATLKDVVSTILRHTYWVLRGYDKAKGYYLSESVMYRWRMFTQYRLVQKLTAGKTLKALKNKSFVYFPLHIEPETALHGLSPEYFYQQAAIAAISRDLPAGVLLVVKEAFGAIGRRPKNFYHQLLDFKNVILLETWESGMECAKQADAVVTICGTVGLEAVQFGTPVITFGRHNLYNFLPSVKVVTDETMLVKYLRQILLEGKPNRSEVKDEGRRLNMAIKESSFDLLDYDYFNVNNYSDAAANNAANSLLNQL